MRESLYAPGESTLVHWLRPEPRKRVAVAFSGMFRNDKPGNKRDTMRRTMDSYRKHLELANPDYAVDFFFHVYIHPPAAELDISSLAYLRTFPNVRGLVVELFTGQLTDEIASHFGDTSFDPWVPGFNKNTDCSPDSPFRRSAYPGSMNCIAIGKNKKTLNFGFLSGARKLMLANELVKEYSKINGVKYDFVIRARLDRFLGADLVLSSLPATKLTTVFLQVKSHDETMNMWPNWVDDQFAIGPPLLMDRFTSLYNQLPKLYAETMALHAKRQQPRLGKCTNMTNPLFCPEWILPRLLGADDHHTIHYPIRCWDSSKDYPQAAMAKWAGPLDLMLGCQTMGNEHKKITAPAPHTPGAVVWDEERCAFTVK